MQYYNGWLTLDGTVQVPLDKGGHTHYPLFMAQVAITVLVKCTKHTIHEEVITHMEVVL